MNNLGPLCCVLTGTVAVACAGDDAAPLDARVDAAPDADVGPSGPELPSPPDIPWLSDGEPAIAAPALTPCPTGWRQTSTSDVAECDPHPSTGPDACAADEAHFPGEPACRRVGAPCPAGDWPEALPTDGSVIYVSPAAAAGGDGSMASPHATLADVPWSSLPSGTTVALGKGDLVGHVLAESDVSVVGACAREAVLVGGGAGDAVIGVGAPGISLTLRDVTIGDPPVAGVRSTMAGEIRLSGVAIVRPAELGLFVADGAALALEDVVVRSPRPTAAGGLGIGIVATTGGRVDGTRVVLDGGVEFGIFAADAGTELRLEDFVLRDISGHLGDGLDGRGVQAVDGAGVWLSRGLIEGSRDFGALVARPGSSLTLDQVIVRGTLPRNVDGRFGAAAFVGEGAELRATRSVFADNAFAGLLARDAGSVLVVEDSVVRDHQPRPSDGVGGRGINLELGARLTASRLLVADNREVAIYASGAGTDARLEDVDVVRTSAQPADGTGGRGLNVQEGAILRGERLAVRESREVAVYVAGPGSTVELVDAVVSNTRGRESDLTRGHGVEVIDAGSFSGARLLVERSRNVGVFGTGADVAVTLTDAIVRGTLVEESSGIAGRGINVQLGPRLTAERIRVSDSAGAGIFAAESGTALSLTDVDIDSTASSGLTLQGEASAIGARVRVAGVGDIGLIAYYGAAVSLSHATIRDVDRAACVPGRTCNLGSGGHGVVSVSGSVALTDFEVDSVASCGVLIARGIATPLSPDVDLSRGVISRSGVGACIQVPGYDRGRLTDAVVYRDNDLALESTELPVPEVPETIR